MLLSLFLLLIILLLTAAFQVDLEFSLDQGSVRSRIRFGAAGLSFTVPQRLLARVGQRVRRRGLQTPRQIWQGLKLGLRLLDSFVQRVELFDLQAICGTGDPFLSALGCGGLWSVLGPFFAGLGATGRLKSPPQVSVQPEYEQVRLRLYLHCIFRFRLGQIIVNELKRAALPRQARTKG